MDGRRVPKEGTERIIPADLVFLSLGFTGPETAELTHQLPVTLDARSNVSRDGYYMTSTRRACLPRAMPAAGSR